MTTRTSASGSASFHSGLARATCALKCRAARPRGQPGTGTWFATSPRGPGHEGAEGEGADQRVLDLEAVLPVVRRLVHQGVPFGLTPRRLSTASGDE
jgi:hypothetical protein